MFLAAVINIVSNIFLRASRFLSIPLLHVLALVLLHSSRCESVRIASTLPMCHLPFSITFAIYMCIPRAVLLNLYAKVRMLVKIGNSFSPRFQLKCTLGFTFSPIQTSSSAHFLTFGVTLRSLVYPIPAPSLFVSAILRMFLISPRSRPQPSIPAPYLPLP